MCLPQRVSLQIFDLPLKYLGQNLFVCTEQRIYNLRQFIFVVFNALVSRACGWQTTETVKKQEAFPLSR